MQTDTINYKGYEIEIINDQDAQNPWEAWDNNAPIVVYYDNQFIEHGNSSEINYTLTRDEIKNNLTRIKKYFDVEQLIKLRSKSKYIDYYDSEELINELLQEKQESENKSDQLETIAFIMQCKGYDAEVFASSGYSQGDYVEVLVILDTEFYKTTGCDKKDASEIMKQQSELYTAWAWGDVYGYVIEALDDSCYGYYGHDHDKSGLLPQAKEIIDYAVLQKQKELIYSLKCA